MWIHTDAHTYIFTCSRCFIVHFVIRFTQSCALSGPFQSHSHSVAWPSPSPPLSPSHLTLRFTFDVWLFSIVYYYCYFMCVVCTVLLLYENVDVRFSFAALFFFPHTHTHSDMYAIRALQTLSFLTFIHLVDVIYCLTKPWLTISHSHSLFIDSFRPFFSLSPARWLFLLRVCVCGDLHMSIFKLLYSRLFKVV